MIEFSLGMPAEEYIRKHRSLLNMACDVLSNKNVKALDKRRVPGHSEYLFYYQIPTSHPVSLHAFVLSSHKSLRNMEVEFENNAFIDDGLLDEIHKKVKMEIWIAVVFDTPLGKHIFFSLGSKSLSGRYYPTNYNLLLTPQFLESYQSRSVKTYGRNILHKFFLEEICCYSVGGSSAIFNDYGHFSARCGIRTANGIAFGHMFGEYGVNIDSNTTDSCHCIVQLNSFYPKSLNPKGRIEAMVEYHKIK